MKTIRTAGGIRKIDELGDHIAIFKIREILTEHRKTLIGRITSDPNAYLEYKFQKRLTGKALALLTASLTEMANSPVDLDRYESVVKEIGERDMIVLNNALFYQDIDERLYELLNPAQLKLVGD
jgi:hypothetical protein